MHPLLLKWHALHRRCLRLQWCGHQSDFPTRLLHPMESDWTWLLIRGIQSKQSRDFEAVASLSLLIPMLHFVWSNFEATTSKLQQLHFSSGTLQAQVSGWSGAWIVAFVRHPEESGNLSKCRRLYILWDKGQKKTGRRKKFNSARLYISVIGQIIQL